MLLSAPRLVRICRNLRWTSIRSISDKPSWPREPRWFKQTTKRQREVEHFDELARDWWNAKGDSASLQRMNPSRLEFMNRVLYGGTVDSGKWLKGAQILDVGCGGGFLTENLARLGADVTGIDASEKAIMAARKHANLDPEIRTKINYQVALPEDFPGNFDIVTAMEILEHVDNADYFLRTLFDRLKPGGYLFMSTIARTPLSYLLTIIMGEKILRLVPSGTHSYSKFVNPEEMSNWTTKSGLGTVNSICGVLWNPADGDWYLAPSDAKSTLLCNYYIALQKRKDNEQVLDQ